MTLKIVPIFLAFSESMNFTFSNTNFLRFFLNNAKELLIIPSLNISQRAMPLLEACVTNFSRPPDEPQSKRKLISANGLFKLLAS